MKRKGLSEVLKSQIELSMLTRFAMVFFIMSLAAIMLMFSSTEQKGLCKTQAELTARQIASSINQILVSPSEDERKVIPLIPALSVGGKDRQRYVVNITKRVFTTAGTESKTLVISVAAEYKDCSAAQSVGLGNIDANHVTFQTKDPQLSDHKYNELFGTNYYEGLQLTPSNPKDRTSYLIVLKCKQKTFTGKIFLYLQNCNYVPNSGATFVDPANCLDFNTGDIYTSTDKCGFG